MNLCRYGGSSATCRMWLESSWDWMWFSAERFPFIWRKTMAVDATDDLLQQNRELRQRLDEAEEILSALRSGAVDGVVVSGVDGEHVYTLRGADEAYRVMVEGMADGALTLTPDGVILFSNQRFVTLVGRPVGRVIGAHLREFVTAEDESALVALLGGDNGRKAELRLRTEAGGSVPVYVSVHNFVVDQAEHLCVIVTDLTEQKRNDETAA